MLVVASWMWRATKIVSDSEWAVTRLQFLLDPGGFDIDVGTWDHPAIWRSIQSILRSLPAELALTVEWTKGHATEEDIQLNRSTAARRRGNEEADRLATAAAKSQEVPLEIRDAYFHRLEQTAMAQAMMTEIVLQRYLFDMKAKRQDADHNDADSQLGQAGAAGPARRREVSETPATPRDPPVADEDLAELAVDALLDKATPKQLWHRREEIWGLHPWQLTGWALDEATWQPHVLGPLPQKLGLTKRRNLVDGIDTQWKYPRPLLFAMHWYLGRLRWTQAEAAAKTPWWLLVADLEMATRLRLASLTKDSPVDLPARAFVMARMVRRVGELCRSDPVPFGYAKDCQELCPFGFPACSGVRGLARFLTAEAPYVTIVSLWKQCQADTASKPTARQPDYDHAPPTLYDVRSDAAAARVQGGHAVLSAAAKALPKQERREASLLARRAPPPTPVEHASASTGGLAGRCTAPGLGPAAADLPAVRPREDLPRLFLLEQAGLPRLEMRVSMPTCVPVLRVSRTSRTGSTPYR
jgi:hypothetical protein